MIAEKMFLNSDEAHEIISSYPRFGLSGSSHLWRSTYLVDLSAQVSQFYVLNVIVDEPYLMKLFIILLYYYTYL